MYGPAPVLRHPRDRRENSSAALLNAFMPQLTQSQSSYARQSRVPEICGDFFGLGGDVFFMDSPFTTATADIPLAGGSRRMKVAENNKALPQDRVFFLYNHFHKALEADNSSFFFEPNRRSFDVDRYTIGFEKSFHDGLWSLEVRAPASGQFTYSTTNFGITGGKAGNLSVVTKVLLTHDHNSSLVTGVGIDLPTGADVLTQVNGTQFTFHNEAVHLSPYIGYLETTTNEEYFLHAFSQIDIPASGNPVEASFRPPSDMFPLGVLTEQTLLHVDVSFGKWFFRKNNSHLSGLAGLLELHYTTTLQDSDLLTGPAFPGFFRFENSANRVDVLNMTAGLHAQFGPDWELRVAGSFPLRSGDDRLFNSEFQVQINHNF